MGIEQHHTVADFRAACDRVRAAGGTLGLVPTMGALHEGHMALMREASRHASVVAATIFVNPTQFGPNEDFAKYPRTLDADVAACEAAGVSLVFAPSQAEMYPAGEATRVHVDRVTAHLCGRSRPGHFDGVATIVAKLFAVAGPCVAVFGRKDYQQLKVIERMASDLMLPVRIIGVSTVREPDGVAKSSRNAYLSSEDRARARLIPTALSEAVKRHRAGERSAAALRRGVQERLEAGGLRVDYVAVADADSIEPLADDANVGQRALLALAVFCGSARLIDNVVLGEDPAPIPEPSS